MIEWHSWVLTLQDSWDYIRTHSGLVGCFNFFLLQNSIVHWNDRNTHIQSIFVFRLLLWSTDSYALTIKCRILLKGRSNVEHPANCSNGMNEWFTKTTVHRVSTAEPIWLIVYFQIFSIKIIISVLNAFVCFFFLYCARVFVRSHTYTHNRREQWSFDIYYSKIAHPIDWF